MTQPITQRIGASLKSLRKKKGLTLRDVADITGMQYQTIGRIEVGKYNVSLQVLERITDALGASIKIVED